MITPAYLKPGDSVAIISPARKVLPEEMKQGISLLQQWGLNVIEGNNLYCEHNQFAGTDEQRTSDFQWALDDPGIKAIFAARGGYGGIRILDKIDFSSLKKNPKWLCGYSDFTYFLSHINHVLRIEGIHGPMPFRFNDEASITALKDMLFGAEIFYSANDLSFSDLNRDGSSSGILTGGNLSILSALNGSISDIQTQGKILFIEDLDEYLYHIDRMMITLKRAGKFKDLAGLIIGGMSDMKDNQTPFGSTVYEIIKDAVKEYDFPVGFGLSSGHIQPNYPLIMGRKVKMKVTGTKLELAFEKQ